MKTLTHSIPLVLALLLAGVARPATGGEAEAGPGPDSQSASQAYWVLSFENDTPKRLVTEDPRGGLTYYWYMTFRVKNPSDRPLPARLDLSLVLRLAKDTTTYKDLYAPLAQRRIEEKVAERPLLNWLQLRKKPLEPGQQAEGIAIFRVGDKSPDFDRMTIRVVGLAARRALGREGPESNVRKFRDRVLLIGYDYVPSKWTRGKELKYAGEEWELVESDVADRDSSSEAGAEAISKKLEELRKKMEEQHKLVPPKEEPPPPKSSAVAPGLSSAVGKPNPKLLAELRAAADRARAVRASYTEVTGPEGNRQTAGGTIFLGKDNQFALERIIALGTERSLKELRVFDGKSLWIDVATKEIGDIVRRWSAEATKPEWRSLDGRPEVDFATVVNPVRAWRLFGDALVPLGLEQLATGPAYVLEICPGQEYRNVLEGPLSGELLGQTLGRRVRFWIGVQNGFQVRMRIYDDAQNVLASLEVLELETDAHIDPSRFVFTPPSGLKVIDMNAAMADNGGPASQPTP